jgi:hypothetical protein
MALVPAGIEIPDNGAPWCFARAPRHVAVIARLTKPHVVEDRRWSHAAYAYFGAR